MSLTTIARQARRAATGVAAAALVLGLGAGAGGAVVAARDAATTKSGQVAPARDTGWDFTATRPKKDTGWDGGTVTPLRYDTGWD